MTEGVAGMLVAGVFVFGMLCMPYLFVMYLVRETRRMAEMLPEDKREEWLDERLARISKIGSKDKDD